MALSVALISCGFGGSMSNPNLTLSLPGRVVWSERGTLPRTTTGTAPYDKRSKVDPMFTVIFPVDTWIAIGENPNAATAPHFFVPALTERSYYARPGDKLSAVAA